MAVTNFPLITGVGATGGGGDSVLSYANVAAFPATGEVDKVYIDESTADLYLWTGAVYEQQGGSANDPRIRIFRSTSDQSGAVGVDQTVAALSCVLDANKHYYIECFIRFNTAAAALWNITHRPQYTGTINALYATVGGAIVSNQNILSQPPASAFLLGNSVGANNTDFSPAHLMISLSTGGSSSTFTYAFRSSSNICIAKAGSFIRVTELS